MHSLMEKQSRRKFIENGLITLLTGYILYLGLKNPCLLKKK